MYMFYLDSLNIFRITQNYKQNFCPVNSNLNYIVEGICIEVHTFSTNISKLLLAILKSDLR